MIRFACPACRKELRVADTQAGTKTSCPYCGQRLQVPRPRTQTVLGDLLPDESRPRPSAQGSSDRSAAGPSCSCPHCGRTGIPFKPADAHTVFECAKCGGKFTPMGGAVQESSAATPDETTDDAVDYDCLEPPAGPRVKPGVVLVGIAALLGVAVSLLILIAALNSESTQKPNTAQSIRSEAARRASSRPPSTFHPGTSGAESEVAREIAANQAAATATFLGIAATVFFIWLAVVIGVMVLHVLLLSWVAKDCRARGADGGAVWVVIVLLSGIVGFLVYLASRPVGILVLCDHCGNRKLEAARSCPHCGYRIKKKRAAW